MTRKLLTTNFKTHFPAKFPEVNGFFTVSICRVRNNRSSHIKKINDLNFRNTPFPPQGFAFVAMKTWLKEKKVHYNVIKKTLPFILLYSLVSSTLQSEAQLAGKYFPVLWNYCACSSSRLLQNTLDSLRLSISPIISSLFPSLYL